MRKKIDVCEKLFEKIKKPEKLELCKAINVYDNKYRINIYTKVKDIIADTEKIRITQSYFAYLKGDELIIRL